MQVLQLNVFESNPFEIYQKPKKPWDSSARNKFLVDLNNFEPPPLSELRTTPKKEKTVPEILKVGDLVKTSYGSGPYKVQAITLINTYGYPPCYSLSMSDPGRKEIHYWINEIVAVGGRLLMLFKANNDEVFIMKKDGADNV